MFAFLRRLKSEGVAIVYVSHRMEEITQIADRATILRDGRHVVTAPLSDLPLEKMIEYIVGRRSRGFSDVVRGQVGARQAAAGAQKSLRPDQAGQSQPRRSRRRGRRHRRACWEAGAARSRACCSASIPSVRAKS